LNKQSLHWRHDKRVEYVEHIEKNTQVQEAFKAALSSLLSDPVRSATHAVYAVPAPASNDACIPRGMVQPVPGNIAIVAARAGAGSSFSKVSWRTRALSTPYDMFGCMNPAHVKVNLPAPLK